MSKRIERCNQCRWWFPCPEIPGSMTAGSRGFCHRFPPTPNHEVFDPDRPMTWPVYPTTTPYDVCGEFTPREKEAP